MKTTQKGFGHIEALLIILILAVVGFGGYYVWHSQHNNKPAAKAASSTSSGNPSPTSSSANYVNITQWDVRAPYSGSLSLSYEIGTGTGSNTATFSSKELTNADVDCLGRGGLITRYNSTAKATDFGNDSQTIAQYAAGTDSSTYGHVGGYYYFFSHDQAGCGANPDATMTLQQQTNSDVKDLVSKLQSIPQ